MLGYTARAAGGKDKRIERDHYPARQATRSTFILLAMATKKKATKLVPKLSKTEEDLFSHLAQGYQLEVTGAEGAPVLRRLKDNEIVRPPGVNRSTIRALEERGLISPAEGEDKLTTIWRAKK
jgi:hypothetical protein